MSNWEYENNELGANYFLIKKSTLGQEVDRSYSSKVWNSLFSMDMKMISEGTNLPIGSFIVKTYSSLNAPPLLDHENNEIYYPTIGIAQDTKNITFFTFKNEKIFEEASTTPTHFSQKIETGKYKWKPDDTKIDGDPTEKNIGF